MKKTTKTIIALVTCIVIIAVLFFISRSIRHHAKPIPLLPLVHEEEVQPGEAVPVEVPRLKGVRVSLFDRTQHLNWKLDVEQVVEEGEVCFLSGIKGEYYTVSGEKYLVKATEGQMASNFTWLRLFPDVVIVGEELKLQAAEANWDAENGGEISGHQLQVAGEKVTMHAEEFTFNPEAGGMVLPGASNWSFR
jgi:hypothetical protein